MHLVEILLPLRDERGTPFAQDCYESIQGELTERFGGVTAFARAPAHGTYRDGADVVHDDICVYEVMAGDLDREWWRAYRRLLERMFKQDEIAIRASVIERL